MGLNYCGALDVTPGVIQAIEADPCALQHTTNAPLVLQNHPLRAAKPWPHELIMSFKTASKTGVLLPIPDLHC